MFKEFLMRKLIESKLGSLPKEERERIITVVSKNPQLFQEIALKVKQKTDSGVDQGAAMMTVMREYEGELKKLMAES